MRVFKNKLLRPAKSSSVIPQENKCCTITLGDSATSNHYFASHVKAALNNMRQTSPPTTTIVPNHSCIQAHQQGNLSIPALLDSATNAKNSEDLNHSLMSLGKLCDDDYTVVGDGLWDIPFPQNKTSHFKSNISYPKPTNKFINVILRTDQRTTDLKAYRHTTLFSPIKSTFLAAINIFFITWSCLITSLIPKYFVALTLTILDHIKQECQRLHTTKPTQKISLL